MSALLSLIFYTWLGYWSYRVIKFVLFMITCHVLPSFGIYNDLKKYGQWAIITGATDGIGKAYAVELAKQKFNILLISRTEEKLQRVAEEIKNAHGVDTKYIVFDFSTPEGYEERIGNVISDLDVGVLVNNVGMSSKWDRLYDELEMAEHIRVMHTNTFGEMQMTYMLTKKMIQQKRGIMIHISSFFGYYPIGLISVYSPTKAFVNSFVQNLQAETKHCKDVHHQLVTPFFVATNMTKGSVKVTKVTPDAATFAGAALRTVGLTPHTFGYWTHDILGSILMTFPLFVFGRLPFVKSFQKHCKNRRLKTLEKSE